MIALLNSVTCLVVLGLMNLHLSRRILRCLKLSLGLNGKIYIQREMGIKDTAWPKFQKGKGFLYFGCSTTDLDSSSFSLNFGCKISTSLWSSSQSELAIWRSWGNGNFSMLLENNRIIERLENIDTIKIPPAFLIQSSDSNCSLDVNCS